MLPLLLAIETVAQAESAFAAAAAQDQWAAFRATAAPDAVMYAPGRTPAARLLARLPAPPPAERQGWRPAHTITSCDTTLAYSTGPTTRGGRPAGWYGTIWRKGAEGWRGIYDNGHDGGPRADAGRIEDEAACPGPSGAIRPPADVPGVAVPVATLRGGALATLIEASDGPMPTTLTLAEPDGEGGSADRSLIWRTNPVAGGRPGAHLLRLWSWDGRRYRLAVLDWSAGG